MNRTSTITRRIEQIKAELAALGDMRPGSLSVQSRSWGGQYWQLSYTHRGKGRTEYVRKQDLERARRQVGNYKRFSELIKEWVDLAIELCKLKNRAGAGKKARTRRPSK